MGSHYQWTGKPKRGYDTASLAESHRDELEAKDGKKIEIYQCWCKQYHVGHQHVYAKKKYSPREHAIVGIVIGILRGTYDPKRKG